MVASASTNAIVNTMMMNAGKIAMTAGKKCTLLKTMKVKKVKAKMMVTMKYRAKRSANVTMTTKSVGMHAMNAITMPILKMKGMMAMTKYNASMSATATMMMNNAGKLATSAGKVVQAALKVATKATEENASKSVNATGRTRTAGEDAMSAGRNSILPKTMATGMMAAGTTAAGTMAAGTTPAGMANGGEDYRTMA